MIRLFITVTDITTVMAAGYTQIRVYTDISDTGTFVTLDGTVTLVAGTGSYEYIDIDGASTTWYKTAYFGAVPGQGALSAARKGDTRAAYATVDELRDRVGITQTTHDVVLAGLLDAAAEAMNAFCNRPRGFMADAVASARYYAGTGEAHLKIDECVEITTVAVKESPTDSVFTAWTTPTTNLASDGDWIAYSGGKHDPNFNDMPYSALMVDPTGDQAVFTSGRMGTSLGWPDSGERGTRSVPTVRVTAKWGHSVTVDPNIREANVMQAARWYKRMSGSMSDTLASGELGMLVYTKSLDPDVQMILVAGRFVKPMVA